jgi:hypothetical protein
MNEKISEKKVMGRTVTIVLGIICIILAVALVGIIAQYVFMIDEKDNEILFLKNEIYDLNKTINLSKWDFWVEHQTISHMAGNYNYWNFSANYAGYVIVRFDYDNTTTTYVRTIYSAALPYINKYDNQIDVRGTGDQAILPILPSTAIQVRIGNSELVGATEIVTITYAY